MKGKERGRRGTGLWAAVVLVALTTASAAQSRSSAWVKAGSHPADYDMGLDRNAAFTGNSSGYIKSATADPQGFGTYMQMFDATEYLGKRLRFSAYVMSENVKNHAALWMRIDGEKAPLAFDNMQDRPIKDTQGWTQHAIVLDVAPSATRVAFGILLAGEGAVWIDDVTFEIVGEEVPITDMTKRTITARPRNLDFESGPERR